MKKIKKKVKKNSKISKIRKRTRKRHLEKLKIPSQNIEIIAKSLKKKFDLQERESKYAPAKEVLTLLAAGVFLAASIVMPGLSSGLKMFINQEDSYPDKDEWKGFNPSYLAKAIKMLERQKLVEIIEENGLQTIKITDRGKKKVLKYALDELEVQKPKIWDGRWYFVTYDIPRGKDWLRNIMRDYLEKLGFYRFHESLYIHAYPCRDEVEFLREYLDVAEYVKVLVVSRIENDEIFRDYFGV